MGSAVSTIEKFNWDKDKVHETWQKVGDYLERFDIKDLLGKIFIQGVWSCCGVFNAENPALLTFKVLTYLNFNEDMGVIKNRSVSQFSSQDKCYFLLSSIAT